MLSISYAITVCNEIEEIQRLVGFLLSHKRDEDEIIVLMDENGTEEVNNYLNTTDKIKTAKFKFNKDFSQFKNHLNSLCSGDYIFNIDADEYPSDILVQYLPQILEDNPEIKAFALPRVNTVEGLTQEHIQKWGWRVDDENRVNYPDYQIRIYKRDPNIFWEGKVHETLNIKKEVASLPYGNEDWALYHPKQIERQEKQNKLYEQI